MPRTVEQTIYKFDELSDRAKEKAMDWYRQGQLDYDWWEFVYEQADTAAKHLGIELDRKGKYTPAIFFSGFSSQGDGACFEGSYTYKKGWRAALMGEFGPGETLDALLALGKQLQDIQQPQFYKLQATCRHSGHYQRSGCMAVMAEHADSMYRDIGDAEDELRDALRSFADWIYDLLENEHDYLTADEQVAEAIRSNEYEFTVEGKPA
uniref:Antitoxin of toxin-antitoxin stability system n=1 Tax=viral metagenome TaxID=1070528 RepID=A0A6M3M9D2_9ZZZZ